MSPVPGTVLCTLRKPCGFETLEAMHWVLQREYGVDVALSDRQRDRDVFYAFVVAETRSAPAADFA